MNKPYYNELLDFYEGLLTKRQKEIMDYYYRDDLSFNEISDILGISKSAIGDLVKRVEKHLRDYEDKLKLAEKHRKRLLLVGNQPDLYQKLLAIEEE